MKIVKNIKLNENLLNSLSTNVTMRKSIPRTYKNWHHKMYKRFGDSMDDSKLRVMATENRKRLQELLDEKKRILRKNRYGFCNKRSYKL